MSNQKDAPKRKLMDYVNTQIQEQSFKEWNKLKYTCHSMSREKFNFMCQMDVYYSTNTSLR